MDNYTTLSKDFPRCGTCIYWNGEKEVWMDMVKINVDNPGKCGNSISASHGCYVMGDGASCCYRKSYE